MGEAATKQSEASTADGVNERPEQQRTDAAATAVTRLHALAGNGAVGRLVRGGVEADARLAVVRAELDRPGEPLDAAARASAELELGAPLPDVRIHRAPAAARAVNATAFASGGHVVLGESVPAPDSAAGRRVLLHELAHVLQQRGAMRSLALVPPGAAAETQADSGSGGAATSGIARIVEKDLTRLSDAELDAEYELTRRWIAEHPTGDDHDAGLAYMEEIETALRGRAVTPRVSPSETASSTSGPPPAASSSSSTTTASTDVAHAVTTPQPVRSPAEIFNDALSRRAWSEAARALAELSPADRRAALDALNDDARQHLRTASSELDPSPTNPVLAETEAPPTQLTPQMTQLLGQVAAELTELEPLVRQLVTDVPANPADHALNEVRGVANRVEQDRQGLADLATIPGAPTSLANAVTRLEAMKAALAPVVAGAVRWHEDNPAGESLGMWNERQGTELAGSALRHWDEGGWGYVSGSAAITGAFGVAFLDAAEKMFSFGFHDAATAVSQAYTRGDISWNEGERILRSAAWRALLIAAVTRGAGMATSRLGAVAARGMGLAPEALGYGVVAGGLSGGTTSAIALGAQSLFTSALQSQFQTPAARAIWRQGIPQGSEWAIAIPLGVLFGAAGGVNAVQLRNAQLVGTTIETPGGPMRIVAITPRGTMVLQPTASTRPPPPPPPSELTAVYDPATDSWSVPTAGPADLSPPVRTSGGSPTSTDLVPQPTVTGQVAPPPVAGGSTALAPVVAGGITPAPTATAQSGGQPPALQAGPTILALPAPQTSPVAQLQLATLAGIRPDELQVISQLPADGWDRIFAYARANTNIFSVKGKIAEELFLLTPDFQTVRQGALARAASEGIPAGDVRFVQDVRGVTPSATSGQGTGELTDGAFVAVVQGRVRVLAVLESKSPSNLRELARRPEEYLGQMEWDYERMQEVPTMIGGTTYQPSQVDISRTRTDWVGIAPPGRSLSAAGVASIRSSLPTFRLVNGPVRDQVLNELATRVVAAAAPPTAPTGTGAATTQPPPTTTP
jgi:hypothetical protein